MNGIAALSLGEGEQLLTIKIRAGPCAAQSARYIRLTHVQRLGVIFGIDGDGANAELRRRTQNANSDFAAIGN